MASPMVQMSRAIRHVIEDNSKPYHPNAGLRGLEDETLNELANIVSAFAQDLIAEHERRRGERVASQAPPPKEPDV